MIYGFLPLPGIMAAGTGKTLIMVRMVLETIMKDTHKGVKRTILSNLNLKNHEFVHVTAEIFKDSQIKKQDFVNKIIVIDELQEWIDSRIGSSKQSISIQRNLFLQNRHQDTDIFYTVQNASMIDKRLANTTAYYFFCRPLQRKNPTHFEVTIYSNIVGSFVGKAVIDGRKYFGEYDTKELI